VAHRLSTAAVDDLVEVWSYVALESSATTADRLIDSIAERFTLIAAFPQLGRRRNHDLGLEVRSFPVGEYVIFYEIEHEDVLILRVLHGHRDIDAIFSR